jgi:hypothetical protein
MARYVYSSDRIYWAGRHGSQRAALSATFSGFDQDILKALYSLDSRQLTSLIRSYREKYGSSSASYARKTYPNWKQGITQPSAKTIGRLLESLPEVLGFDAKCELIRKLRERHRRPETLSMKVTTSDWQEAVVPAAKRIILKARTSTLPTEVENKLTWLTANDAQAAQALLAHTEAYEGALAVSMLKHEFSSIEAVLSSTRARKVKHTIRLPHGNINLTIKRSKYMPQDNNDKSLTTKGNSSLFKPRTDDILDEVFSSLDEKQVAQVKSKAADELVKIAAEKRRAEIKTDYAQQQMEAFINNADELERRKKDYRMHGRIESASGYTEIEVSRNWSQTIIIGVIVLAIVGFVLTYAFRN